MSQSTRAAVYARVSTDEQAEHGTSLNDQLRRTEKYCAEEDFVVVARFRDEGFSGATVHRPALEEMLAGAEGGQFDLVVVTDPDRLSRDLVDGLVIERELGRSGVSVVYLIQPTMGTLERQLRGVIAEEERRKIRDRTSRGLRNVALEGYWPGGPPPFGYRITREQGDSHSRLEIDDVEANLLRWMIGALVDDRRSTWEVAAELNAGGTPTPAVSRKVANRGSPRWNHRRVRDILATANGIAGDWTYKTSSGDIDLKIPAIVSDERLAQLRLRLEESSTGKNATRRKNRYLLAGRLISPCGSAMYGMAKPGGHNRVYFCSSNTAAATHRCDCRRVSADAVEEAVWQAVHEMLTEPGRLLAVAGLVANEAAIADNSADLRGIERKIQRVEKALGSQIAELLAQGVDASAIGQAAAQLEKDLVKLREHRDRIVTWEALRLDREQRMSRVERLAKSAQTTLSRPTSDLKEATLELLEVRARVISYMTCHHCEGRGLVRRSDTASTLNRRMTGDICPVCLRYKVIPVIDLEGLVPDVEALPATVSTLDSQSIPFTIHLSA